MEEKDGRHFRVAATFPHAVLNKEAPYPSIVELLSPFFPQLRFYHGSITSAFHHRHRHHRIPHRRHKMPHLHRRRIRAPRNL